VIETVRRVVRWFESPRLATWLLVFVGAWSVVATAVPQGDTVAAWASVHPFIEAVVRMLDLHHAFSAPLFRVVVFMLAVSTALCASKRTKVAFHRARALRGAQDQDRDSLISAHNLEIVCAVGRGSTEAVAEADAALRRLGIKTKRRGDVLSAVSPWWTVWGSPVFHWGLVALIAVVLMGSLQRSEGMMGVPVGQSVPDQPGSYGVLHTGPLHSWSRVHHNIRVDDLVTDFRTGKIDRGPTPIVSVLDADGRVVKKQPIYPNNPLQAGSLTIHPAAFGFAVNVSLLSGDGAVYNRTTKLVDISEVAPEGTAPLGALTVSDREGQPAERVVVTVPLRQEGGNLVVPQERQAHLVVTTVDGKPVADRVLNTGESIALPSGGMFRIDSIGYYARLTVVHDWSIPLLYAAMAVAMAGLTLTVVVRQQAVLVTVAEGPDGSLRLYASLRFWRNVPTNRAEIETELTRVLGAGQKEDDS